MRGRNGDCQVQGTRCVGGVAQSPGSTDRLSPPQDAALRCESEVQERKICPDVLYRAGRTVSRQETYTPRLILMDLKGSLNSLKQEGCLYGDTKIDTSVAWQGNLMTHQEDPPAKNLFLQDLSKLEGGMSSDGGFSPRALPLSKDVSQLPTQLHVSQKGHQLEGSVRVWSDYLRVHLHPRSIFMIHQYNNDGESSQLEAFGQGESLLHDPTYLEELEDRLHFYVEECDYLQGFQILCDLNNGFSGVGAKVTELLHDEYSGRGILTWGLTPVIRNVGVSWKDFYRLMNTVLGIVHLSSHSSLFCPLSLNGSLGLKPEAPVTLPYVHYDASLNYHSSAILATALDTLSAPYRLHSSQFSMVQLADAFNSSGRKVVAAGAAVPFPMAYGQSLPDALCSYQLAVPWTPLSSCGEQKDSCCFAQSVVLRGIGKENHIGNLPPGSQPKSALHVCETGEEVLGSYLHARCPGTFSTSYLIQGPCKVLPPYPQFFSALLNKQGFLLDKLPSCSTVESIPVLTALQSSPALYSALYSLYKELHRVDIRRWASFFSAGIELYDFQEALHELRTLSQCYKTSSELDESEDEVDSN
ncbi:protein misato homolog 1 isoform X2 [Terrapene carolina triunguis]|uniref:protein misato homolog 1 isoform X2 n=1 Tax=Terrapene triunguis TaxID=2587831 RepID=UPI000E77A129|nr:protein misato homolog 1 isoform X2 [Terrapene carolina triunguis]